ncbi:MAG: tetratricopeptide repeat protein [Acidobacteriota bacterium]
MSAERSQALYRILSSALDLDDDDRRAFLDRACGGDEALRRRVDDLLNLETSNAPATQRHGLPLHRAWDPSSPAHQPPADGEALAPEISLPERLGPYRILDLLGRGGMGAVYLAEQEEPVRRRVALKVVAAALLDPQGRMRFQAERQALARLTHPNIAQMYDAGSTDDGTPYFAMELVEGVSITEFCDRERLDIRRRLELFRTLCEGVAYAHQKGLLHRDLKPSNVLVTDHDGQPLVKIIDFGIAKALDQPLVDGTLLTRAKVLGTPAYMSPEAVRDGTQVDTRSDVYALGVMLYELLVGVRPIGKRSDDPLKILGRIAEEVPKRPSTRWRSLDDDSQEGSAEHRSLPPQSVSRALDGDLDWIVMKAIDKEPERRYGSASELAADIERHLSDEPIEARPPTLAYRAGRFARRHRLAVGAAALLLLALLAGIAGTGVGLIQARNEAEAARQALAETRAVSNYMVELFRLAAPDRSGGEQVTARDLLSHGSDLADERFADKPLARSRFLHSIASSYQNLGLYEPAEEHFRRALAILEDLKAEHPDNWMAAQAGLAWTRNQQGDYDDASSLYAAALAFADRHPAASPVYRGEVLQGSGYVAIEEGRFEDAQDQLSEAARLYRAAGADHRASLAQVLDKLGVVAGKRGDSDEAARLHKEALAEVEAIHGSRHPAVATAWINLSTALGALGRIEEALAAAERSLEVRRQLYGADHEDVARSLTNVGALQSMLGENAEADRHYQEALAINSRLLGADHPSLAALYNNLAVNAYGQGDYEATRQYMERALEVRLTSLGPDHPDVAKVRTNLGMVLLEAGQEQAAEEQLTAAQGVLEERLGREHDRTALNLEYLGVLYRATDRVARAVEVLERAHEIRRKSLAEDHPWLADVRDPLGMAYLEVGDLERAEELIRQALDARWQAFGEDHPLRANSLESLASFHLAKGEPEVAEELLRQALELRQRVQGEDHPELIGTLGSLGAVEESVGNIAEAEARYRSALDIADQRPVSALALRPVVARLAVLLEAEGRGGEARALRAKYQG